VNHSGRLARAARFIYARHSQPRQKPHRICSQELTASSPHPAGHEASATVPRFCEV